MKIDSQILTNRIRTFVAGYIILFISTTYRGVVNGSVNFHLWSLYLVPAFGSLIMTLVFAKDAKWPIYKKGDKVWWSTYGETKPVDVPKNASDLNQKRFIQFVGLYCLLFTIMIFDKKSPIYLTTLDYIYPAIISAVNILFLSRIAIWPVFNKKSAETSL